MKTLDDLIKAAVSRKVSVSDVLRELLVLAYELDNDALKKWSENELNGYDTAEELPEYRVINITACGFFIGPAGSQINNQPLDPYILKEDHRYWAERTNLMQPVASYETFANADKKEMGEVTVDWPPTLTTIYQTKFYPRYVLNRAWQVIPGSALVGLVDIVRNRTLKFALELRKELGPKSEDVSSLPQEKVTQMVTNYIFGGNVVVAHHAHDFTQKSIAPGDSAGLEAALRQMGVSEAGVSEVIEAAAMDRAETPEAKTLGQRTVKALEKAAASGLKVGVEVAKPALSALLMQYLGLSS